MGCHWLGGQQRAVEAEQNSREQREQPAPARAGCHPATRVPGPCVLLLALPSTLLGAAAAPPGDTFIWEVAAVQLRKPGWRLPPPHHRHFPVPKTTMPRPLHRQPQCQERLLLSDRQHVLPLWLPACREAGVGRKTSPEKPGRPLCGAGQDRAEQAVGGCKDVEWLLRLHPTLCRLPVVCTGSHFLVHPATGLCRQGGKSRFEQD